jgi:hypothetical protein
MVLNWDFLLRFGDIVLYQREGRKPTHSEEDHEAEYGAPPNEWLGGLTLGGTAVDIALPTVRN